MSPTLPAHGRCLCGEVTYQCSAPPRWAAYCHCESCRLNTASPVTAFFGMADGAWSWTGKTPAQYNSNPGVRRYFCATCGTPIAYGADRFPGEIHFYTSALQEKTGFEPTGHVNVAEQLPWFEVHDTLPRWPQIAGSKKD